MGPLKNGYINYVNCGKQFLGITVSYISSLTKDFDISQAYFAFQNYP